MELITQLKLLCWKNYVTKKRNKVRLAIEVLLPIILFLVLVFLRRIGNKKILHDCYFKPKAMPSAGDLAFFQSFYCSLNNTCEDSTANASLSTYDSSVVSTIMRAIEDAFDLFDPVSQDLSYEKQTEEERKRIEKFNNYFTALRKAVIDDEELMETDLGRLLKSVVPPNENRTRKFTCGLSSLRRPLRDVSEYKEQHSTEVPEILRNETGESMVSISLEDLVNSTLLQGLDFAFCGPNVPSFVEQLISLSGQTERSWERKKEELESQSLSTTTDIEFEEPEYENDTTPFCNDVMKRLETSLPSRLVWKVFKPFVRGKIIYTPDAPVIAKIMGHINDLFARPEGMLRELLNYEDLPGLRELTMMRNSDQFLKKIINTELGTDILTFFGVKADGDRSNKKTIELEKKALRKIIDSVLEAYNKQAVRRNNSFKMSDLRKFIDCVDWSRTVPVSDPHEAEVEAMRWMETERLWALVEFVGISPNATELPPAVTYKIRTGIERTHATFQLRDRIYRPRVRRDPFIDLKHITGGWAYVQNLVEGEIIRELTGRKNVPGIYLQQTPYPCHIKDMFRESITRTLPMFMIVSWIFLFSMLIKKIVWEKEKKITQTLRVMGMGKTPHWVAWFLDAFVPMFFVSFFLAVILVFGQIIPFASFIVVWMFLVAFIFPTITLAFLVSTCFSRASIAAAVSGLLFLLIYLPYPPISQFEERLDPNVKVLCCLVSNIAFGLGCTWLANMEELGIGGHLDNMHVSPVPGNPINMNLILALLILDACLYLLLALYVENVFPGGDKAGRSFYYFLTKNYWCGEGGADFTRTDEVRPSGFNPEKFESEPEGLVAGVSVVNLNKKFGDKVALRDLTINFFEDQITSFLGHNGAGKSTAISIMTGLVAPTSGSVRLYGRDIRTEGEIRNRDVGMCSQENVLLEDLTVEEHLYFYARVSGAHQQKAKRDTKIMMADVRILDKRNTLTKHLSGGTQRKLCVATAFIGESKIVFLDEPTAGVDPSSRRAIWDLLIKYKRGRTVVLTTHFMDEADLLGDRIAIIAKGRVVCCGSPVFLKTRLGSGYYLTVDCDTRADSVGRSLKGEKIHEETEIAKDLNNLIQAVVPDANFLEQVGSEIIFVVPVQKSIDIYDKLFTALDNEAKMSRIKSYGVSDTSLEEIFLKIAEESENDGYGAVNDDDVCTCFKWKRAPGYANVATIDEQMNSTSYTLPTHQDTVLEEPLTLSLWCRLQLQFWALIKKRALHHMRNYTALLVEIVVPAVFVILALYLGSLLPSIQKMPPLEVDVSAYAPSHMFYSLDIPDSPILRAYERELLGPVGVGTKCSRYPEKCSKKSVSLGSIPAPKVADNTTPCPCNNGRYSCTASPPSPPWIEMSSGDRLYNLTGQNITNWIIKTELSQSYIRYGGVTLGYRTVFNSLNLVDLLRIFQIKELIPFLSMSYGRPDDNDDDTGIPGEESITPESIASLLMTICSKPAGDEILKDADINDNIIIWYNNRGWISGIAYMNAVSNLVLRASLPPGTDRSKYSIRLINHPLPVSARQLEDEVEKRSNISLLRALAVVWALAFIPATYAVYLIGERSSHFKHLQIISGINRVVYWVSTFLWDLACFSVTILLVVLIFLCFNEKEFVGPDSIGAFLLLLFSYATVSITFVYPLSFFFQIPSSGFVAVSTINVFIGMVTLLTTFVMSLVTNEENPFYLNTIFKIFPQFCIGKALLNMSINSIRVQTLATLGVIDNFTYLDWETTLQYVVLMLVMAVFFFILTLIIEYRHFFVKNRVERVPEVYLDEDEDVKNERNRVVSGQAKTQGDVLLLADISKWYKGEPRAAVERLCLGVKAGECFGLLGLNGAGKTTVFKMLTGSLAPSSGDASILGQSIKIHGDSLSMGYCPQSNALDSYLTPIEHLEFFGRLHGLTGKALTSCVKSNIERLGLDNYKNKIADSLSGGNRRKLNTAIALVGNPRILLLDEPTSGMDPRARRFLWQCVHSCVQEGQCVILTSHSMEECQSLCSRLSILVNGRFRCIGTCQHLKSKFDEGYSVTVRCLSIKSLPQVQTELSTKLPTVGDCEVNYTQVKLCLKPGAPLGVVFTVLDQMKRSGLVRDYSISQTTLEQIFMKFAEAQTSTPDFKKHTFTSKFFRICCKSKKNPPSAVNDDAVTNQPTLNGPVTSQVNYDEPGSQPQPVRIVVEST